MYLQWTGHVATGLQSLDIDLRDVAINTVGSKTILYTTTGVNGGLSAFELAPNGGLAQVVDQQYFDASGAAAAAGVIEVIEVEGQTQLVFGLAPNSSLVSYELSTQGAFGAFNEIPTSSGASGQIGAMAATTFGSGTRFYMVDSETGALSIYTLPDTGGQSANAASGPGLQSTAITFDAGAQLETVSIGSATYLLAADQASASVISYEISSGTGALTQIDFSGAAAGLGISMPSAMEAISAFGQTWILLASAGSNSLSVIRVNADGSLQAVDHVIDTLNTRFDGITSLAVAQEGNRVFIVGGGSDDGLSLFTLAPDGRLIYLQTIPHTAGAGLENVTQLAASVSGDHIQVFAHSGAAEGLTQFNIDLAQVAAPQLAGSGSQSLMGGAGQDMLVGSDSGADTLVGAAGDDILISGASGGRMTGGGGLDRFVIHAAAAYTEITDFNPGIDQIDMSAFAMLRSVGQLTI